MGNGVDSVASVCWRSCGDANPMNSSGNAIKRPFTGLYGGGGDGFSGLGCERPKSTIWAVVRRIGFFSVSLVNNFMNNESDSDDLIKLKAIVKKAYVDFDATDVLLDKALSREQQAHLRSHGFTETINFSKKNSTYRNSPWKSIVKFQHPVGLKISILEKLLKTIGAEHAISRIEIGMELITGNSENSQWLLDYLLRHLEQPYNKDLFVETGSGFYTKFLVPGELKSNTGNPRRAKQTSNYLIYIRDSKTSGESCVRIERKLFGTIPCKRAGLRTIDDMKNAIASGRIINLVKDYFNLYIIKLSKLNDLRSTNSKVGNCRYLNGKSKIYKLKYFLCILNIRNWKRYVAKIDMSWLDDLISIKCGELLTVKNVSSITKVILSHASAKLKEAERDGIKQGAT